MASYKWLRTILIVRKETRCRHIGYSYRLTARVLLYAPSHIQDNTYHGLCYTSRGSLAGTRNSSMGRLVGVRTEITNPEYLPANLPKKVLWPYTYQLRSGYKQVTRCQRLNIPRNTNWNSYPKHFVHTGTNIYRTVV